MSYIATLNAKLDEKHLLKHPFYQAWSKGELTLEYLRTYACQYFHHVDAFPRYLSATHSNCTSLPARQHLLDNLNDEERGSENHPELWLRFAEGVGEGRESVRQSTPLPETQGLIDTFMNAAKSSYEEGLGALYAYERQVPEIAASKIDGLQKFYDITDKTTLKFFNVHLKADVHHSNVTRQLLEELPEAGKQKAAAAAQRVVDALWNFLSGVQREIKMPIECTMTQ